MHGTNAKIYLFIYLFIIHRFGPYVTLYLGSANATYI